MENDSIQVKIAQESDLEKINDFNYNGIEVFKQEFFSKTRPKSFLAMCLGGQRVVGTEGFIGYPLYLGGRVVKSHRSERTLIDPKYRGQNLLGQLMDCCAEEAKKEGSEFCWGATGALKPFKRVGFESLVNYRTYAVLPTGRIAGLKEWFRGKTISRNPIDLFKKIKGRHYKTSRELIVILAGLKSSLFVKNSSLDSGYSITEELPKDQDLTYFFENVTELGDFIHMRLDSQLFQWLEEEGKNTYNKIFLYKGGEIRGFFVVKEEENQSAMIVLDFLASSESDWKELLLRGRKWAKMKGKSGLFFSINAKNSLQQKWLANILKLGGWRFGEVGSFVVKPLKLKNSELYRSMEKWYITDLWFELYNRAKLLK